MRVGTLIPESHLLFVCPYSCGRHNAIGALQHGYKDRISYLFIDQNDIALGCVEIELYKATGKVLDSLAVRPKVMLVYVSCVMYMAGLDENNVIGELSDRYPDVIFQICRMNPIASDGSKPPALMIRERMYSLLNKPQTKRREVNLIGICVQLKEECELPIVLAKCGIKKMHHITDKETFSEFQDMGQSQYALALRPEGLLAARNYWAKEHRFLPVTYDPEYIKEQYAEIFAMIGAECDLTEFETEAYEAIKKAVKTVGNRTIAIGESAVCRPYNLARMMIRNGFSVNHIYGEGGNPPFYELDAYQWIKENTGVVIEDIYAPEEVFAIGRSKADIAIGYIAGYYSGAKSVVNIMSDEGMFGYHGTKTLMENLVQSVEHPEDLHKMIESYGMVV